MSETTLKTFAALLTDDEVIQLTGATRFTKQRQVLSDYGVAFFTRPDGKPVVPTNNISLADATTLSGSDSRFNL